ncbi:GNAT family N-acetyltransferase [Luteococcus peritonei]
MRVSLRHVDADGQAHDLVGDLVLADEERIVVLPAGRGPVEVPREQVRAMRRVPPRVVRPSSGVDDLQRLMAEGWPGTEQVRLGGWTLHAGGGHTKRANSAHPTGDPERDLDQALRDVVSFYAERGLPALVQVAARNLSSDEPGARLDREFAGRGWQPSERAIAMTLDLRAPGPADVLPPGYSGTVRWADSPDEDWLGPESSEDPARLPVTTAVDAHYATLLVDGRVAGAGRLVLTRDWGGLSGLVIDSALRGRGHGRALTVAMTARARELGARFCYLQVVEDNHVARSLYDSLGFMEHHRYLYRRSPLS